MPTKHPASGRRKAALAVVALVCLAEPGYASEPGGVYELTIKNTNTGQNFSPPVIVLHAVHKVIVGRAVHRRDAPVFTTELEAPTGLLISVAAMLSLTNDGFVTARSVPLPAEVAATTTVGLHAFDAGSEANTELCAHVPCEIHD